MRKKFYFLILMLVFGYTSLNAQIATYKQIDLLPWGGDLTYGDVSQGNGAGQVTRFSQPIVLPHNCKLDRLVVNLYNPSDYGGYVNCKLTYAGGNSIGGGSSIYLAPHTNSYYTFYFSDADFYTSYASPAIEFGIDHANTPDHFRFRIGASGLNTLGSPNFIHDDNPPAYWENTGLSSLAFQLYVITADITQTVSTPNAATNITSSSFLASWTPYSTNPPFLWDPIEYHVQVATDASFNNILQTVDAGGPGTSSVTINGLTPSTNYYYRVYLTNPYPSTGPYSSASSVLQTSPPPCSNPSSGGTIATNQTICTGTSPSQITSSSGASGGNGGTLEYRWQMSTAGSSSGFSDISPYVTTATYSPGSLTTTTWYKRLARIDCEANWTGAAESNVIQITVNSNNAINSQSTAAQNVCLNGSFNPITVTATGANLSYQWYKKTDQITSGGTTVGTNSNSYTPSASTVGTLYYYCVVTGTCGTTQTSAASGAFTVNPLPVAGNITGGSAVCMGNTLQLTSNATGTATLTYVWHSSNTGVATVSNTGLVTPVATGSTNITYTVTDGSTTACTATSATFGVTVNPLPVAGNITGFNSVCMGSALQLTSNATGTPTLTYVWHSSNTSVATVSNTGLVTPVSAASANITYTVTDGSTTTCSATSANFGVSVNSLPVPAISGSASVCVNSTGNVYTTQTGKSNYTWNVSGGTITSGGTTSSNTATITWNTSGAESVSVNYTTPFTFLAGCSSVSPTIYPVTVNPLPVPTITGNTIGCINSTGNAYSTEAGMTGYTWNVTGGTITSGSTTNTINVTWTSLGAQTISVNYTNTNSCTAATATVKNITVSQLPAPTLSGATNLCNHTTGNIYTTEAGMTSYNWSVTGGTITAGTGTNAITVTWNTEGAQTVSVNYANSNGCSAASATIYNVTLKSAPYPVITGSPDNNYIVPKLATYQYSTPLVAGDLYSWSSPKIEGYCSATARNCVNVHFLDPCCVYGQWTISVTETNPATGCSTIATKLIYITP